MYVARTADDLGILGKNGSNKAQQVLAGSCLSAGGSVGLLWRLARDNSGVDGPSQQKQLHAEMLGIQRFHVDPNLLPSESSFNWGDSPPQSVTGFLAAIGRIRLDGVVAEGAIAETSETNLADPASPADL